MFLLRTDDWGHTHGHHSTATTEFYSFLDITFLELRIGFPPNMSLSRLNFDSSTNSFDSMSKQYSINQNLKFKASWPRELGLAVFYFFLLMNGFFSATRSLESYTCIINITVSAQNDLSISYWSFVINLWGINWNFCLAHFETYFVKTNCRIMPCTFSYEAEFTTAIIVVLM